MCPLAQLAVVQFSVSRLLKFKDFPSVPQCDSLSTGIATYALESVLRSNRRSCGTPGD